MTKRERFLAFANFEPVDRVPRYAGYTQGAQERLAEFIGKDPNAHFDMDIGKNAWLKPPPGFKAPDYTVYFPGELLENKNFSIDHNGCGHLGHGFHHFTEYISPLRNATSFKEIEDYPIASNEGWSPDPMRKAAEDAHANGDFANIFIGHLYEDSWQIRGYEEFLMDLMAERDWAESIMDRICENNLRLAIAAAECGYDCISTGDDVANQNTLMFQPDLWREVMKPRWAKVIAAAREIRPEVHIWYHSDGNVWDILDDLVEIGITILNPVQPECMDPVAIRKRFGKRLAFDGCVGTQTTFPFGTPQDMRNKINELADSLDALNGGLMLSPTHVLEPDVPPENVAAFFEACDALCRD